MKKNIRIVLLRCVLALLILLNMTVIFLFSEQNGEQSHQTSSGVSEVVANATIKDFDQKPKDEQQSIISDINKPLRKIAHMAEFGSLGALVFLFLLTWNGKLLWRYGAALAFTFVYACTDEWHQSKTVARGPQFTDVLIDLSGALIVCSIILLICTIIKQKRGSLPYRIQTTHYHIKGNCPERPLCIAIASDLHCEPCETPLERIRSEKPDLILIPGDLMDDTTLADSKSNGYHFLRACAEIAPTFYSLGNHEIACYHKGNPWRHPTPIPLTEDAIARIRATGVHFLDNDCVRFESMTICGIGSGINGRKNKPDTDLIRHFAEQSGYRILLCHHPEYFVPYIKGTDIELTVCGHAHGGQWRIFGRGIYAPGQGLFPKYTAGVLENRCVISRGLSNHTIYPRLFNTRELVILHLE